MSDYTLYLGDCLEYMRTMEPESVDAVITDLPYGTTACNWDEIIPFVPMWEGIKRILKPRGVFVTTASQPFTSKLIMSNLDWFRDEIIWRKSRASRYLDANKRILKAHENIIIFSNGQTVYNPQMRKGNNHGRNHVSYCESPEVYHKGIVGLPQKQSNEFYPQSVIDISNVILGTDHPTQKPVDLYSYLIQTYTNPDALVFDMCMGSGTTGVAALQLGRRFIGCEIDPGYFAIAEKRIKQAAAQILLPLGAI